MASRRLTDLDEPTYIIAEAFVRDCEKQGLDIVVACTYRSPEEQEALYAQGRQPIEVVNKLRKKIGIYPLGLAEDKIVTYARAGESWHNKRRAMDVYPCESGKLIFNTHHPAWKILGETGEKHGFEWSGRWKRFKEWPHFQNVSTYPSIIYDTEALV